MKHYHVITYFDLHILSKLNIYTIWWPEDDEEMLKHVTMCYCFIKSCVDGNNNKIQ
jgi:hypothetical protein